MKIDEQISRLTAAMETIKSAPQKGFVNLDQVCRTIEETAAFLREISPRLTFGEKLSEDLKAEMLNKINTLSLAGGEALLSQAKEAVQSGILDYDQIKTLKNEIDILLEKLFAGQIKSVNAMGKTGPVCQSKHEDYR